MRNALTADAGVAAHNFDGERCDRIVRKVLARIPKHP